MVSISPSIIVGGDLDVQNAIAAAVDELYTETASVIENHFYTNYNGFATATGVKIVPITTKIDNDWGPKCDFASICRLHFKGGTDE